KEKFEVNFEPKGEIANIVVAGMGGSALAAGMAVAYPSPKVPMVVSRQYGIPSFVNEYTLFVASSYSGNTEETLAALEEAEKKQAQIVVVAAGGKLEEIANQKNYPFMKIPSG